MIEVKHNVISPSQIEYLINYWNNIECKTFTDTNVWDINSTAKTKIVSDIRNVEIIGIKKKSIEFLTEILNNCFSQVMSEFVLEGPHYFTYYPIGGKHSLHGDGIDSFDRKWVITLMLNDDFGGGELVIDGNVMPKEKGCAILYDGNLLHEVREVTSGERFVITECAG